MNLFGVEIWNRNDLDSDGNGVIDPAKIPSVSAFDIKDLADSTGLRATWNAKMSGTPTGVTITPAAGAVTSGVVVNHTPTGVSAASAKLNAFYSLSETLEVTTGFLIGLSSDMQFGGTGTKGGREAIQGSVILMAPTQAGASNNRNYVGIQALSSARSGDTGTALTDADSRGAIIALGAMAEAEAGATNLKHVNGMTINYAIAVGASAFIKEGLVISGHTNDKTSAAGIDTAIAISGQGGSVGTKTGIVFTNVHGNHPLLSTGTLIATDGTDTVARGIDFSSYVFSENAFMSPGFSVSGLGKLSITRETGSQGQGFAINHTPTGSATNFVALNRIIVLNDTMTVYDPANPTVGYFGNAFTVDLQFGGAGTKGGRQGIQSIVALMAPTEATNNNRNYVGVLGQATIYSGDGGTDLTLANSKGQCFGMSACIKTLNGATNLKHACGMEIDTQMQTGSSAAIKEGLVILSHPLDKVSGTLVDCALAIAAATGGVGFDHGILFTDAHSKSPIKTTGTLIATDGSATVANGIDLSSYTITGDAFKSTGFAITGSGGVESESVHPFRSVYEDYGVLLRHDATSFYLLLTDINDQWGTFNALRPFTVTVSSGNVNLGNGALFVTHGGSTGVGNTSPTSKLTVSGPIATAPPPANKTTNYAVLATDSSLNFKGSASIAVTLPDPTTCSGRNLHLRNLAAFTVVSASANVAPLNSETAGTAILAAAAGKWAHLQSNGTVWIIMAGN